MLVLCFQRSGNDSTSNEIAFDMLLFGRLEQNFFTCLNFSKALFFCIILMMSCPVFLMSQLKKDDLITTMRKALQAA